MESCHADSSQMISAVLSMNDVVLENDTGLVSLELKEKETGMLSDGAKLAELIESIKDGKLTLDQYLFGFQDDHRFRLQYLCTAFRSGTLNQPTSMSSSLTCLTGHPERPLSLDELSKLCNGDFQVERQSIRSLRAELNLFPSEHASRSSCLLRLADALYRRFFQWDQRDDLEEAIWSYEEALSLLPNTHYQYLETLLGLCASIYQRFYLLGHADDLQNLLRYLDLQYDVLNQQRSLALLAPVEAQFRKLRRDSSLESKDPESEGIMYWPSNISPLTSGDRNPVFYPASYLALNLVPSKSPIACTCDRKPRPGSRRSLDSAVPCERCVKEVQSSCQPASRHPYSEAPAKAHKKITMPCTHCQALRIRCRRLTNSADACEHCVIMGLGSSCEYRSVDRGSEDAMLCI